MLSFIVIRLRGNSSIEITFLYPCLFTSVTPKIFHHMNLSLSRFHKDTIEWENDICCKMLLKYENFVSYRSSIFKE